MRKVIRRVAVGAVDGRPMAVAAGSANRWMFRVAVMMARGRGQWRAGKKATPFRPLWPVGTDHCFR